jgi:type I restriction enzyme R subunit
LVDDRLAGRLDRPTRDLPTVLQVPRVIVERIVDEIDSIVRLVRFDGWQATLAGERQVKRTLRASLLKYKLHKDQELFDKAYGYIKQHY